MIDDYHMKTSVYIGDSGIPTIPVNFLVGTPKKPIHPTNQWNFMLPDARIH